MPQQVADLAQASVPQSIRGIRACKRCGILKTVDQFINEGCENCPFLDMVKFYVRWLVLFLKCSSVANEAQTFCSHSYFRRTIRSDAIAVRLPFSRGRLPLWILVNRGLQSGFGAIITFLDAMPFLSLGSLIEILKKCQKTVACDGVVDPFRTSNRQSFFHWGYLRSETEWGSLHFQKLFVQHCG